MKIEFNHKLSMMHGYLTPIDCFPVVPGDTHVMKKIASLIHMSLLLFHLWTILICMLDVSLFLLDLWRGSSVDDNL